jgi:hypothetical protein
MKINVTLTQNHTSLFSESDTSLFSENDTYLLSGNRNSVLKTITLITPLNLYEFQSLL